MPKPFSQRERQIITEKLIEQARELFIKYGIKKTAVEDITKTVGIAKGSFYQFFGSKEDLFQEVFEREVQECRRKISLLLTEGSDDAKKCIKTFIKNYIGHIDENPFFKMTVLQNGDLPGLKCMVTEERIKKRGDEWIELLTPHIEGWQKKGALVHEKPEIIAATLRSTVYLLFHKNEIGTDVFPDVIELLSELISSALLKEDKGR